MGGVQIFGDGRVSNSRIHANTTDGHGGGVSLNAGGTLRNCLVYANHADGFAGGVIVWDTDPAQDTSLIQNCSITDNTAGDGVGGILFVDGGEAVNSIVYDNTAPSDAEYGIVNDGAMTHCCTTPDDPAFTAIVTNDPAFVGAGDYRLQSNSPCVNTGMNEDWMIGAGDLDGNARILNAVVDMGAYESAYWGMYADVDGDGFTDWVEVDVTGTDPTNAASFLGMMEGGMLEAGGGIVVRWQSVAGKLYHVDRATNLVEDPAFTNWMAGVPGLPDYTAVTDTTATAEGPYFYRVGLDP